MSIRDLLAAQHRSVLELLDGDESRSTPRTRKIVAQRLRAHLANERDVSRRLDARARAELEERHHMFEHLIERFLSPGSAAQRIERARLLREMLVNWFDVADRVRWKTAHDGLKDGQIRALADRMQVRFESD